jgi:hypothetical protein
LRPPGAARGGPGRTGPHTGDRRGPAAGAEEGRPPEAATAPGGRGSRKMEFTGSRFRPGAGSRPGDGSAGRWAGAQAAPGAG